MFEGINEEFGGFCSGSWLLKRSPPGECSPSINDHLSQNFSEITANYLDGSYFNDRFGFHWMIL